MRVLIAEDDPVTRLVLRRGIEQLGHECLVAEDGAEAWTLFSDCGADAIVSDWLMPNVDGLELCRRVREQVTFAYPYFILLTGHSEEQDRRPTLEAGADDFLTKPVDVEELQARLIAAERITSLHRQIASKSAQLERLNRALLSSARIDLLTQLGNRLRMQEDLLALQGRVTRYRHRYSLALIDIDRFKAYNDRYGPLFGDRAIREVADTLRKQLRSGDGMYRYGGEEFLAVLPEQTLETGTIALERIRSAVQARAIRHEGNPPFDVVTISAGVASFTPGENIGYQAIIRRAGAALYRAKADGPNRVAAEDVLAERDEDRTAETFGGVVGGRVA